MFNPKELSIGDKVSYNHDGERLPAEVLALGQNSSEVQLRISGWLGKHFVERMHISAPITKVA